MTTIRQFSCPSCTWSLTTPTDETDLMQHIEMHAKMHHPEMVLDRQKVHSMIKEFDPTRNFIPPAEYTEAWRSQTSIGKRM